LLCSVAVISCNEAGHEHHHEEDGHHHEPNEVEFHDEMAEYIDFSLDTVRTGAFGNIITATAVIENSPTGQYDIVAGVNGCVMLQDNIAEGSYLTAGQNLCSIVNGNIVGDNINIMYSQIEAEYEAAKDQYQRHLALARDRIISQEELQESLLRFKTAESRYQSIGKGLSRDGQNVSSPVSGFVSELKVRNGQHITAGETIAVVCNNRSLRFVAMVSPRHFESLDKIIGATFRSMDSDRTWTLEELGGKLISYGKNLQQGTTLLPVTFEVSDISSFVPGSHIKAYIRTTSDREAISVPCSALIEEMGNYYVFVKTSEEHYVKTMVKPGSSDGRRMEILEGLIPGQEIVGRGAAVLKLSQQSGTLDAHAGHNH